MSFFDQDGDKRMARQNQLAWDAIVKKVIDTKPNLPKRGWNILDWGCHSGGLLERLKDELSYQEAKTLDGVEPDNEARSQAQKLLPESCFYGKLSQVPYQSVDIFVSNEVLYLVDLDTFFMGLDHVLRSDGAAFVALGSHSENSAWMRWRDVLLEKYGHTSVVHDPWWIVQKGHQAGFIVGYQPLWPTGYPETNWYSLPEADWGEFESMQEALAFRQAKLLFQFWPRK